MICQHDGSIRFTKTECANIVKTLVKNPPFVRTSMHDMLDDKVYTFFENPDGTINFVEVNDDTQLCKAYISEQFMDNFLNIVTGTGVIFHHYERMLVEFFPAPHCQTLTFDISASLRHANNVLYYRTYPRVIFLISTPQFRHFVPI